MTTPFYSNKCTVGSGIQPRSEIADSVVVAEYDILAALLTADVIHMVTIPAGATLLDVLLAVDDLETAAGNELTLSVGYTGALEAFISQSVIGQTGGVARATLGIPHLFAAEDTIQVSATAGAEIGATSGKIVLTAKYTFDP